MAMDISQFRDAKNLIDSCRQKIPVIKQEHGSSLVLGSPSVILRVTIKEVLEHLRSALDYLAVGLAIYCGSGVKRNTYFPYAPLNMTKDRFIENDLIEKRIPGLRVKLPTVYDYLLEVQHFTDENNHWLPKFMQATNTHKHVELSVSEIREQICFRAGSLTIICDGITLGPEAAITTDAGVVRGPLSITRENLDEHKGKDMPFVSAHKDIYLGEFSYPFNVVNYTDFCIQKVDEIITACCVKMD